MHYIMEDTPINRIWYCPSWAVLSDWVPFLFRLNLLSDRSERHKSSAAQAAGYIDRHPAHLFRVQWYGKP